MEKKISNVTGVSAPSFGLFSIHRKHYKRVGVCVGLCEWNRLGLCLDTLMGQTSWINSLNEIMFREKLVSFSPAAGNRMVSSVKKQTDVPWSADWSSDPSEGLNQCAVKELEFQNKSTWWGKCPKRSSPVRTNLSAAPLWCRLHTCCFCWGDTGQTPGQEKNTRWHKLEPKYRGNKKAVYFILQRLSFQGLMLDFLCGFLIKPTWLQKQLLLASPRLPRVGGGQRMRG